MSGLTLFLFGLKVLELHCADTLLLDATNVKRRVLMNTYKSQFKYIYRHTGENDGIHPSQRVR